MVTLPEKALASFTGHDIEVIAIGFVPTYTADLETPIFLLYIDGGYVRDRICFLVMHKAGVALTFFMSLLQVCFWKS